MSRLYQMKSDTETELLDRIVKLENQLKYWDYKYSSWEPYNLTAKEIIERFNDIYKYLGVERVSHPPSTELVKEKKQ